MEERDDHIRCEWVNVSSGTGSPGRYLGALLARRSLSIKRKRY